MLEVDANFGPGVEYRNAFVEIAPESQNLPVEFHYGTHTFQSRTVNLGTLHAFESRALLGYFAFRYSYDDDEETVTVCGTDFESDDAMCLTTFPEGTTEYCHQRAGAGGFAFEDLMAQPHWNYRTPLMPGLEKLLQQMVRSANTSLIDALKINAEVTVKIREHPPALPAEEYQQLLAVYRNGELLGPYDPTRQYGPGIVVLGIESVYGGSVYLKRSQNFANVIGSSDDPTIGGMSWITLWRSVFPESEHPCTSLGYPNNFPCGTAVLGGHVVMGKRSKELPVGSDLAYIVPICHAHNNNDRVHMEAIEHREAVWLKRFMERPRGDHDAVGEVRSSPTTFTSSATLTGGETMDRLSDFGMLGFGINVFENEPTEQLVDFTYQKVGNKFNWNGQEISVADQISFDPSPRGQWESIDFTSTMRSAREYQIKLEAKLGLEGTDPETDLTFKGDASAANTLFARSTGLTAMELYEADNDFVFLSLRPIRLSDSLTQQVKDAVGYCGDDVDRIMNFYDTFGTHVVARADIGGRMHIRTVVEMDAETSKRVHDTKLNIAGQVESEDSDYAKGNLKFGARDQSTEELYRRISRNSIELIGGSVTSLDESEWRATLMDSKIPTQGLSPMRTARAPGLAAHAQSSNSNQSLALINLRYQPIYEVLPLGASQLTEFQRALREYLNGLNPFESVPQRLKPRIVADTPVRKGQKAEFVMRGWMATYETYAGLEATPGTWALVECKSDAEPGGWDLKTVYSGEVVQLRGKTPYFSRYMYVHVKEVSGDENAVVYAENRLVSW